MIIKTILDKAPRPMNRFEVEQKFRKFRDVPPSGLSGDLREMAKRGEIDRHAAGLYWRKGTVGRLYETQNQQLYRLVHDAPGHRMANAELAVAMHISRKDFEALLSHMRKRREPRLFEPATGVGVAVVSAESLAALNREGRIVDSRGGTFFSVPKLAVRAKPVTFTTLHPNRPPVDITKLAREVARLKGLKNREQIVELDRTAKALGVPPVQLELMVRPAEQAVKNAERKATEEAAKENWRAKYRVFAEHPEQLPVRTKLWEEARGIPGLTRQLFREVISEEARVKSGPRGGIRAKKSKKYGANSVIRAKTFEKNGADSA
jgi:hypothetical protein